MWILFISHSIQCLTDIIPHGDVLIMSNKKVDLQSECLHFIKYIHRHILLIRRQQKITSTWFCCCWYHITLFVYIYNWKLWVAIYIYSCGCHITYDQSTILGRFQIQDRNWSLKPWLEKIETKWIQHNYDCINIVKQYI